ncbi:hypothetical protein EDC04DRAFT_1595601 [Pisolithus marmoratus]|nr:hypothetical protein EDC04DRAFT_1595601 [Pisolithus marmoratus]
MNTEESVCREEFSITQDKLLRHGEESKEPAFELLKDMFGVKHLRCMVGDITFFEQLASPLSMGKELGTTVSKGNMSGSPKPCVKQLVIALLQAMNGVTHAFQLRQSSGVVEMRHMTHWVATTLGAEFLADISVAFLGAQEAFNDVKSTDGRERKRNSSVADNASVQSLVDEVADLQLQYHKSKNDDERLVLEQDIVGTILLACRYGISSETQQTLLEENGVLRSETTDMSTPLLEREERVNCLRFIGDIFEDAFSDAPLDNHFHLRWPMANAKAGISMHKLYLASCSGWKVGGTSL